MSRERKTILRQGKWRAVIGGCVTRGHLALVHDFALAITRKGATRRALKHMVPEEKAFALSGGQVG